MGNIKKAYLRFFESYSKLSNLFIKICIFLGYIFLAAVSVVVILSVFYRYVLGAPLKWAEEIARYLLIWLTLTGASVAIRTREHIRFTSVVDRLGDKAALILDILLYLIIIILLSIVEKNSLEMVMTSSIRKLSPAVQISMVWPHSALPVGLGLIIFQSLYVILEDIKLLITGEALKK